MTDEDENKQLDWCNGLGFLIIMTVIVYFSLLYFQLLKPAAQKFVQ